MSKIVRPVIPLDLVDADKIEPSYRLIRLEDRKVMYAKVAKWVSWSEEALRHPLDDTPAVGKSLVLDPTRYSNYTWLTTVVTEIVSTGEGYIKFKTLNSTYELSKLLDSHIGEDSLPVE